MTVERRCAGRVGVGVGRGPIRSAAGSVLALLVLLPLPFALALAPTPVRAQDSLLWHGELQVRYARGQDATGLSLRRGKLWLQGPVPRLADVAFKIQGLFRDAEGGAFVLQDLYADLRRPWGGLQVGQMVPAFSLQRSQREYLIPLVERADVVRELVPSARTLGRDVGAQLTLARAGSPLRLTTGVFSGSGANRTPEGDAGVLVTGRLTVTAGADDGPRATVGGSASYRRAAGGIDVGPLSAAGPGYRGRDVRWGLEARAEGTGWALQGEWLEADLAGEVSRGFYLLGDVALTPHDQVALSVERLRTAVATGPVAPWYIVGYTHLLAGQEYDTPRAAGRIPLARPRPAPPLPTKVMAELRLREVEGEPELRATIQLQLFFH